MTAAITVGLWLIFINAVLFGLPFVLKFNNPYLHLLLRRCIWIIAIYFSMLTTTIVATLANNESLPVVQEMLRITILTGWVGYVFIIFTVVKSIFDCVDIFYLRKTTMRTGD